MLPPKSGPPGGGRDGADCGALHQPTRVRVRSFANRCHHAIHDRIVLARISNIRYQPADRPVFDMLWVQRAQADALVIGVSNSRDLYLTAIALEFSGRLALATGERDRARQHIERALKTVAAIDVRLAA